MEYSDTYYCRWSYDEFRLREPHVKTDGLWKSGNWYYIKCDDISLKPIEETELSLSEYFAGFIKIAGAPVKLTECPPGDAVRISNRSHEDVAKLQGAPLTTSEFNQQFAMMLPLDFPTTTVSLQNRNWLVSTDRNLTVNERKLVTDLLTEKSILVDKEIIFQQYDFPKKPKTTQSSNLMIHSSKFFQKNISFDLQKKWEQDEQIWIDDSPKLWTNPQSFTQKKITKTRCLINLSFEATHDIRNYIMLFEEVIIVAPLDKYQSFVLEKLGVTEIELIKLVEIGKIIFVYPYSLENYRFPLIEKIVDVNPNAVILTRELAIQTVIDSRKRNPFLYPSLSISERQSILSAFIQFATDAKENQQKMLFESLSKELIRNWSGMESFLAVRGAMGTNATGSGLLLAEIIRGLKGKDYRFELTVAAEPVEWAGALNATVCPIGSQGEQHNVSQLAYMLSGNRVDNKIDLLCQPNLATEGILTMANYVPAVELAKDFKGGDIQRFYQLVKNISTHHRPEEIDDIVENFNKSVKQYESRNSKVEFWDIKGLLLDGVTMLGETTIPTIVWRIAGDLLIRQAEKNSSFGYALDKLKAVAHNTTPDAILVSRLKSNVRKLID